MVPWQAAAGVTDYHGMLEPWRAHAPTAFVMGLQKSGTTLVGATLAAAMGTPYQPEAAWDCCKKLEMEGCARKADEYEQTYNFLPHGHFYSKDMSKFFEKCGENTLLRPPQQVPMRNAAGDAVASAKCGNPEGTPCTEMKRFPITLLKADEMLPDAPTFANFARDQRLNFQLVYVTRHPLTVIRATQSWIKEKQSRGKHMEWDTSVAEIAKKWRRAARLATEAPLCESSQANPGSLTTPGPADGPRCTFAAVVRYEDLMADPHTATVDLYSKLFPRSGGHFPGRPAPPRSAAFPAGWHERVSKAMDSEVAHTDDFARHTFVNESFTDDELTSVGNDGGHDLMKGFNYTMADSYVKPMFH